MVIPPSENVLDQRVRAEDHDEKNGQQKSANDRFESFMLHDFNSFLGDFFTVFVLRGNPDLSHIG